MKRSVVHFEIGCSDIGKATAFYKAVFDWQVTRHGNAGIIDTGKDGAWPGHLNQLGPNDPQNYVTVYIETESLESDLKAVAANGGEVFVYPVELPDGRVFAWFKDVAGNLIGLITPTQQ